MKPWLCGPGINKRNLYGPWPHLPRLWEFYGEGNPTSYQYP